MKILISTPYYLPNVSGITVYVQILAEELVKDGYQVEILTSRYLKELKKEENINGVKIKRVWAPIKIGKGVIMPFFPIVSLKEIFGCEVINCHLPEPESIWMSFWGKLLGKKIILTHHTDLSFWKGLGNKIIDSGVFVCQFLAATMADYLVSYTLDYAQNSYFLKRFLKKTKVIYPPIKFTNKNINIEFQNKLNRITKNKKYVIGFCGRIAKQKGIEILIKSTKLLDKELGKNNYIILMAGPKKVIGENYYGEIIKKYKNIIKDKFIFLDNVSREKLNVFYKKIDLLVLPSNDRLESFGWVQVEAMMMKTPCVATNLPGMRIPILESGMGKIFENNNFEDLAEKMVLVLKKDKKYFKKNYSKMINIFDYNKSIRSYEELFNKT